MIKILDDSKSLDVLVNDNSNGLGIIQPISAVIVEELNGIYELDFKTNIDEKRYNELKIGGLVSCVAGEKEGTQIFRISKIIKNKNGIVDVNCKHITYDLNSVLVKPFSSTGAVQTKNALLNNVVGTYPFTMTTNIANSSSKFVLDIPKSFRECLGGWEGSILDVFRCEYEFDNLVVKMNNRRGVDTDVRIAYGKNLVDLQQDENIENTYNAIVGFAKNMDDSVVLGDIQNLVQTSTPKVKIVDFSANFDDTNIATKTKLNDLANQYAIDNKINVPSVNITVSFVQLSQTDEYKDIANLERVGLGDTVKVSFPKLNVEANSKVIKRTWNCVLNRYDSIELGDTKANLTTAITNSIVSPVLETIKENNSYIASEMDQMSSLIINGLGLHKTVERTDGGGYRYYLHNKPTLAESDTQYVFTSEGFLVSTDYGATWNAGFDSQGNVIVNSLSTIVLRALEIYGSTITFGDIDDKFITAAQYQKEGDNVGISFDGNGYVRFRPQETFSVYNKASDGTSNINSFVMEKSGSSNQPYVSIKNNDVNNDYLNANFIELDSFSNYNRAIMSNKNTKDGTLKDGNYVLLTSKDDGENVLALSNRKNSGDSASVLNLRSRTGNYDYNQMEMQNYIFNAPSKLANSIYLTSNQTPAVNNNVSISNNDTNGDLVNQLSMFYDGSSIYTSLANYQRSGSSYVPFNIIRLDSDGIRMTTNGNLIIDGHIIYFEDGVVKYRG